MTRCRRWLELESPCGGSGALSSRARQAEDMLQSIVSCQRQRDETRREVLARRAIFVSSFKSLPSRDVSSRPALPAICLHHPPRHEPKQSQAEKNNCGGGAGSADLVIDETNQATGKRVFSTVLGRSCDGFPVPAGATPTPTPVQFQLLPRAWEHAVKPLHSPGCPE